MHGVSKSHPQRVRSSGSCLGEAGTVPFACHNEAKMLPAEHETMGVPAEAEAAHIANGVCAGGAAGGSRNGRCRRARGGGRCQRIA